LHRLCGNRQRHPQADANYALGSAFNASEFVSFSYSSNLINFVSGDVNLLVAGILPTLLPAAATVGISNNFQGFSSNSNGTWVIEQLVSADFGPTSTWSVASASTPEPATMGLEGLSLAALRFSAIAAGSAAVTCGKLTRPGV
jgi:hypothetical protein